VGAPATALRRPRHPPLRGPRRPLRRRARRAAVPPSGLNASAACSGRVPPASSRPPPRPRYPAAVPASSEERDARLAAEACRLHERYTVEVIERFNLCPWAHKARQDGEVARRALLQCNTDPRPTLELLSELEAAPRPVTVCIAVYPRLSVDPRGFDA